MKKLLTYSVAAIVLSLLCVGTAGADDRDQARAHYQRGNQLFHAGDFQGAILEFDTANKLAPSPVLSFNVGLCYDRLGDSKKAIAAYRTYLKAMPKAANRGEVEASIRRLKKAGPVRTPRAEDVAVEALGSADAEQAKSAARLDDAMRATQAPENDATSASGPGDNGEAAGTAAEGSSSEDPNADGIMPGADSISDPALARAADIDVAGYRDQYAQSTGAAGAEPRGSSFPPPESGGSKATPFYKKWWFWVAVGVGGLVVISVATSSSSSQNSAVRGLFVPDSPALPSTDGAVLLRF